MSTMALMQRLFPPGSITPGMSKDEFSKEFDRRLKAMEEGGFLSDTALPKIEGEEDLVRKLALHKARGEMVVVKYWKRGCIPCLSKAEMFKEAEQQMLEERPGSVFYSVDIHSPNNRDLADRQLINATPAIQTFWDARQVGGEVNVNSQKGFMDYLKGAIASCRSGKCPESTDAQFIM